ncbi:MAG: anti-sigma factor, partial [Rhodospirillaceae bacterium]
GKMNDSRTLPLVELHAYVDGQLPADEIQRIEAWLADHPDDAAAVHAYRLQNARLDETFGAIADEPVPANLTAIVRHRRPAAARPTPWLRLAASLALIVAGRLSGWVQRGMQPADGSAVAAAEHKFVDQALGAHRVFVAEVRHPVEVPSSQEAHLVKWLSKRLGTPLKAPDMRAQGYELVGGRLLAEGALPAAQFMYENGEKLRLTVYVHAADGSEDTAFRFLSDASGKGNSAFYWIDKKFTYALVAPLGRDRLMPITNLIYDAQQRAQ